MVLDKHGRWAGVAGLAILAAAVVGYLVYRGDGAGPEGPSPRTASLTVEPAPAVEPVSAGEAAPSGDAAPAGDAAPVVEPVSAGDAAPVVEPVSAGETAPAVEPVPTDAPAPRAAAVRESGQKSETAETGLPPAVAVEQASPPPAPSPGESRSAAPVSGTPDTGQPAVALVPPSPVAGCGIVPGFDIVRVDPDGNMVAAGRAAPHSTVTVRDDAGVIGTTRAGRRGAWTLIPDAPLAPGNRQLRAIAECENGDRIASGQTLLLVVPDRGLDIAGRPAGDGGGEALAMVVPAGPEGVVKVLQAPAADKLAGAAAPLRVETIDHGTGGKLQISGAAGPGADIRVYLDNDSVGTGRAGPDGRWSLPTDAVPPGPYTLRVDRISPADGTVTARVAVPFVRAEPVAGLPVPADTFVVVQPGNSLWRIARSTYGRGIRFTTIYEANADQIRDPDLIYPGQVFLLPRDG